MIRRAVVLLLALLVPIGVLGLAGRHLLTRGGWAGRAREAVAIQLAQTLDSEVRVGQVQGDPLRGFRLRDVSIADGRTFADGTLASAKTVEVKCNAWAALRRGTPPIEAVEIVRIVGLRAELRRGPDGKLNVQRLFPTPKPSAGPKARFRGRVIVEGGDIRYADRSSAPQGLAGLDLTLARVDGIADFARPGVIELAGRAEGVAAPFARVELAGSYRPRGRCLSLNGGLTHADLPSLARRFAAIRGATVRTGSADAAGNLCLADGRLVDYAVVGRATDVAVEVASLRGETVRGEAEFSATPAGIGLRGVRATVLGASITGEGAVIGLAAPVVDFAGAAENVDVPRWTALAPKVARSLPEVSGASGVRVEGRVTGPLADPDVTASAAFPEAASVRYAAQAPTAEPDAPSAEPSVLEAQAAGLGVTVSVPDWRAGDAVIRVQAAEAKLGDLAAWLPGDDYLTELQPAPIKDLQAEITVSRKTAAVAGRVDLAEVSTDRGAAKGVQVRYAMVGHVLRGEVTAQDVLGGKLGARGMIDLSQNRAEAYANFDADSLDLSAVAGALEGEAPEMEGRASAVGTLAYREGRWDVGAEVSSREARVESVEIGALQAHVGLREQALEVRSLTATGPLGVAWARGTVPFTGPLDVEATVAGVPLGQVQALLQPDRGEEADSPAPTPVVGLGFAHGRVRGEVRDPKVTADVALFDAGTEGLQAAAVTATVEATAHEAVATNLLARRGTAVLSGAVAVRELVWPPGSYFAEAPPAEGPTDPGARVDGELYGSVEVKGFELEQIDTFATLPDRLRVAGLAEAEVGLSGSIRAPVAEGRVSVADLRGADLPTDITVGPLQFTGAFTADPNAVSLREGRVGSRAGSLEVTGEAGGWNTDEGAAISARFEARGLPISAYTPADGPAALLEGTIDRVSGSVQGPLSGEGPAWKASMSAQEVRFGRRSARELHGDLGYSHGVFAASSLACEVAEGAMRVRAASYQPSDRKMFADLTLADLDAQALLFLAADIASAGRADPEAATRRDRIYAYGHRVRGAISARQIVLGGRPASLEGRVRALRAEGVALDRRAIPGLTLDFHFAGLALDAEEGVAGSAGPGPAPVEGETKRDSAFAHLRVDGLRAQSDPIGDGIILVHGTDVTRDASLDLGGDLDVIVEADLVPVGAVNDWLPAGLGVGGDLSLTVRASGPADDPEILASVDILDPTVAGVQFDLLQAANIDVRADAIAMTGGLLKRGPNEARVEGSLPFDRDRLRLDPDGPVAFEARVEELPTEVPLELAGEFAARGPGEADGGSFWRRCEANGLLTAWLRIEGRLRRPEVTGGVSLEPGATFRLAGWSPDARIEDLAGDILLGPSPTGIGSTVEAFNLGGRWQETRFTLEGSAEVSHLEPDEWLRNRIEEVTLKCTADKQRLPGGTLAREVQAVLVARTDPEGRHIVTVEEGSAKLGRGSATLTGHAIVDTLDLRQLASVPCDLRLVFDHAQVQHGGLVDRAQVDGALVARKFAARDGQALPAWFLEGRTPEDALDPAAPMLIATAGPDAPGRRAPLEITRARLGLPRRRDKRADAAPSGERKALLGLPATLPAPRLDITLATGHSVDFETAVSKAEVVPDAQAVRLTGTPQAPELRATATTRHGSLRLLRGNLEVPNAGVRYHLRPAPYAGVQPPPRRELLAESEVWGRAEGTVSGRTVTGETIGPIKVELELTGGLPPDHVLTTHSDPPLTSSEVYELLAVGPLGPGGELSTDQNQTVDQMIASAVASRVFGGVLEPIQEELSEVLGLEQFDIRVGLNQPVEFRVGKYLVDNLLVSYMRTAGGPNEEYDLRVSYKLRDKYQLTWHADERQQSEFAVEYRWQF